MDAGLILGLTLAVLGLLVVVLGTIAALVLGPAVRRALAERRDEVDAALAADEPGDPGSGDSAAGDSARGDSARGDSAQGDSAQGAEHRDRRGG